MTRREGGPPGDARAAPRPLIGRERELGELLRVVTDPGVRLVTITGRSGVGKSHLARELAAREPPGGGPVIVVDSSEARVGGAVRALSGALGVGSLAGGSPLEGAVAHISAQPLDRKSNSLNSNHQLATP